MTRKEQIKSAAKHEDSDGYFGFIAGAEWADATNPWKQLCEEMYNQLCWTNTMLKHYALGESKVTNEILDKYEALKGE